MFRRTFSDTGVLIAEEPACDEMIIKISTKGTYTLTASGMVLPKPRSVLSHCCMHAQIGQSSPEHL